MAQKTMTMPLRNNSLLPLSLLACALSACSHSRLASEAPPPAELVDSQVEISYGLGHTHRKVIFLAKDQQVSGQTVVHKQILRESKIESARYHEFFQKISDFINKTERNPASDLSGCRNPFMLTMRVSSNSKILKGCRSSSDEGALGRLIRDGEFLFFSKK